ncbi:hypothetical protein [Micromonospora thermarum]|uniref:hypothetical protein n=1 Tax=Micromonospora thermarum TaxID=2720024 RepID=UPI001F0D2C73|nr:hypothetical protein [Micromonospora thermarum]
MRRPDWRARWAERENERRRRAHDADAESWRRRADELARLRAEVDCFHGYHEPGLPVDLEDDEVVFRVLPAAELVEATARHLAGLPAPGLAVTPLPADAPGRALPRGLRVTDAGLAVVTDRRVAFAGPRGQRHWWYADLTGPAHHAQAPVTLLHTIHGGKLAGLRVPPESALNFRFYLTLAFADVLGDRDVVAAYLDEQITAHEQARPAVPDPADADVAPQIALLHDRRIAVGAAAVAMLVTATTVGIVGHGRPASELNGQASAIGAVSTVAPTASGAAATTSAGPGGEVTPPPSREAAAGGSTVVAGATGGVVAPVRPSPTPTVSGDPQPQPTSSGPQTSPSPSAAPTEIDRCGAPPNPYGYNYCGGALIHQPAADVCSYFPCMADFLSGSGHLVTCRDGLIGLVGGQPDECADHRGIRRTVYA